MRLGGFSIPALRTSAPGLGPSYSSDSLGTFESSVGSNESEGVVARLARQHAQESIERQAEYDVQRTGGEWLNIAQGKRKDSHDGYVNLAEEFLMRQTYLDAIHPYQNRVRLNGHVVSPLAKRLDRILRRVEMERDERLEQEHKEYLTPANNLAEWFDAGLKLARPEEGGGLCGKQTLPLSYERAIWSSPEVPLVHHKPTSTVVWPVRLNLLPFFQHVERRDGKDRAARLSRTVYYYTSMAGMRELIRPPEDIEECNVARPEEWSLQIWECLQQDMEDRAILVDDDVPEGTIACCSAEPASLETKLGVLRAVYRTESPMQEPASVGYCIALLVPYNRCEIVAGRLNVHTIYVQPPWLPDDGSFEGENMNRRFSMWSAQRALGRTDSKARVSDEVRRMGLLNDVVDRSNAQPLMLSTIEEHEDTPDYETMKGRLLAKHGSANTFAFGDAMIELCRGEIQRLQKEKEKRLKKLKEFYSARAKFGAGGNCPLLLIDPSREKRLTQAIEKVEKAIRSVQYELNDIAPDLVEEVTNNSDVTPAPLQQVSSARPSSDGGAGRKEFAAIPGTSVPNLGLGAMTAGLGAMTAGHAGEETFRADTPVTFRRRRRQVNVKVGEFTDSVKDTIVDVHEEYCALEGDLFRDVFGGNKVGVLQWLKRNGDPNQYDKSTGWTPLIMATSSGDPEMVKLLLENQADIRRGSKKDGSGAAHLAVQKTEASVLRVLLQANETCLRERNAAGATPLLMCMTKAPAKVREEYVKIMLDHMADANAVDNLGWSPLMLAVSNNYRSLSRLLVTARGNVLDEVPGTKPTICIWQLAEQHAGLQQILKSKLSSRDMHLIEKSFPGSLSREILKLQGQDLED